MSDGSDSDESSVVPMTAEEVAAQDKRLVAFNQAGIAGWLLWRSVYLTKQVAFRNRVLVLFDWLKSRVFGRDIACL